MPSARDIAFVGCRLLALYIAYGAVQSFVFNIYFILNGIIFSRGFSAFADPSRSEKLFEIGTNFVPLLTGFAMFAVFWFGAGWIAGKIAAGTPAAEGAWSPRTVLSVGVIVLGLSLLIWTIPHLASFLYNLVVEGSVAGHFLTSFLVMGSLGVGLILGSQRIADFIGRLRRW